MSIETDSTREFLKNLPPLKKVQFLTHRKHILQQQMGNMSGRVSFRRVQEIKSEIKVIERLIKIYL